MKTKTLTILIFFFGLIIGLHAQESEHLTFKGIPIDGKLSDFVLKMKENGLVHRSTRDGIAYFQGDFAEYKSCVIAAHKMAQKDLVYSIVVLFPDWDTWMNLSGNYFDLKKMLTIKYGEPIRVVEQFESDSQPRDDNDKLYELRMNRCKYYSIWELDKGNIELSIEHGDFSSRMVKMVFFDKINMNIMKGKALRDL